VAGFRKAKPEQAAVKIGVYGPSGSGKTFSSLLFAEGLAKQRKKKVAYVDTERGTDFYSIAVQGRSYHPAAFEFEALYSRSITEVLDACTGLSDSDYGVVVIDSMTHLWNACIDAYEGKKTRAGTIPMHAWGTIKKPYKQLMEWMLASPMHVIICGRQGNEYGENPEKDGELKMIGYKMKAEGETPYEPHVLIRMEPIRRAHGEPIICAYVEKDRTGVLSGKAIQWPTFENVAEPLLNLLGETQSGVSGEDAALQDAETIALQDANREQRSIEQRDEFVARFQLAKDSKSVEAISKEITPKMKKSMLASHVSELREAYLKRSQEVK
jgi:hypothetical protein